MPATLEDLNIVIGALTSCKTKEEIARSVALPLDIVEEVLETLRKLGKISKDQFADTYCPLGQVAATMSGCCNIICNSMEKEV